MTMRYINLYYITLHYITLNEREAYSLDFEQHVSNCLDDVARNDISSLIIADHTRDINAFDLCSRQ